MRKLFVVLALLAGPSCTEQERQDIVQDVKAQAGVSQDSSLGAAATKIGATAASKAGNPIDLGIYIGGLVGAVVAGYVSRKFVEKKYDKLKPVATEPVK